MGTATEIELIGGPRDGERHVIEGWPPCLTFAVMPELDLATFTLHLEPSAIFEFKTITYVRRAVKFQGQRGYVYEYGGS